MKLFLTLFIAIYSTLSYCQSAYQKVEKNVNGTEQYGLKDENGKLLLAVSYDKIFVYEDQEFPYALVEKDGKKNLYNLTDRALYFQENQREVATFNYHFIAIDNNGMLTFLGKDFEKLDPYKRHLFDLYGKHEFIAKDFIFYSFGAYYGAFDRDAKVQIPFVYKFLAEAGENKYVAAKDINDDGVLKYGMIDIDNNIVVPLKYEAIWGAQSEMCISINNGKVGYFDAEGNLAIPHKFDTGNHFVFDRAEVTLNGETFIIDKSGNRLDDNSAVSGKPKMLMSHASIGNNKGVFQKVFENVFVWDPATAENRTYYRDLDNGYLRYETAPSLTIPKEYLYEMTADEGLIIEMSINKNIVPRSTSSYDIKAVYYALAYSKYSGVARVFEFKNGQFNFVQDLDAAKIDAIKGSGGEIRMQINAMPTHLKGSGSDEYRCGYAGIITAWNTKTGANVTFLQNVPSHKSFDYYPNFKIEVPDYCLGNEGHVMMSISSYDSYGSGVYQEAVFHHFVYNSASQNAAIYENTILFESFFTEALPKLRNSGFKHGSTADKPIKYYNSKMNAKEVTMTYQITSRINAKGNPMVGVVDNVSGLATIFEIGAVGFQSGATDQTIPSIKEEMAAVKTSAASELGGVYGFVFRERVTPDHSYLIFNKTTGDIITLNYRNLKSGSSAGVYTTDVGTSGIENNVLFSDN